MIRRAAYSVLPRHNVMKVRLLSDKTKPAKLMVHKVQMPKMEDISEGTVDQWMKKAGDMVKEGEVIAHVTLGDFTVGVTVDFDGIVAELKAKEGDTVKCDAVIAHSVDSQDDYTKFLEIELKKIQKAANSGEALPSAAASALSSVSPETVAAVAAAISAASGNKTTVASELASSAPGADAVGGNEEEDKNNTASSTNKSNGSSSGSVKHAPAAAVAKDVLREIKVLINKGVVEEESDFARKILSLARAGDKQLLAVFEASYEDGVTSFSDHEKFDYNFFLDNATDILIEKGHKDVINPMAISNSSSNNSDSKRSPNSSG